MYPVVIVPACDPVDENLLSPFHSAGSPKQGPARPLSCSTQGFCPRHAARSANCTSDPQQETAVLPARCGRTSPRNAGPAPGSMSERNRRHSPSKNRVASVYSARLGGRSKMTRV
jgi:hypothetical protein